MLVVSGCELVTVILFSVITNHVLAAQIITLRPLGLQIDERTPLGVSSVRSL